MKKTLIAVAALSAMAASAMAADVTLYGRMDMGVQYNKVTGKQHTTEMKTGQSSGNRWGIKTTEDLGNGYKVGVTLESGYNADDGKSGQGGRLFGRDAFMQLDTPYGQIRAGRTGTLADGCTGDMVAGKMTPFGTTYGYAAATNSLFNPVTRVDNAVRLQTPKFAGFQAAAEYANNVETGVSSTSERYAAIGVSYAAGNLYTALVAEQLSLANPTDKKDPVNVTFAANYNFGVAKVFAGYQYAKHATAKSLNYKAGAAAVLGKAATQGTYYSKAAYESTGVITEVKFNEGADEAWTDAEKADRVINKAAAAQVDPADAKPATGVEHAGDAKANVFMIGASAPVCGGTAMAAVQYIKGKADQVKDSDFSKVTYSVGYKYSVSKRTTVYAAANYVADKFEAAGQKDSKAKAKQVMAGVLHTF